VSLFFTNIATLDKTRVIIYFRILSTKYKGLKILVAINIYGLNINNLDIIRVV